METTKLMLWAKLIITHLRFLSLQVVVKGFQNLRTSTTETTNASLVRHWLVTGQLDHPSKFKYAKLRRNCLEDLKSLKDLYQDYWGMGERKTTGVLADSTTSHVE